MFIRGVSIRRQLNPASHHVHGYVLPFLEEASLQPPTTGNSANRRTFTSTISPVMASPSHAAPAQKHPVEFLVSPATLASPPSSRLLLLPLSRGSQDHLSPSPSQSLYPPLHQPSILRPPPSSSLRRRKAARNRYSSLQQHPQRPLQSRPSATPTGHPQPSPSKEFARASQVTPCSAAGWKQR
ncbi:hypothetical protein BJX76DRAFT_354350 [Aspergillus varians]